MYYSHSIQQEQVNIFMLFLERLAKGDDTFKTSVLEVLNETHSLVNDQKDLFELNRENYSLVLYLRRVSRDFFKKHNISELRKSDYNDLLTLLKSTNVSL